MNPKQIDIPIEEFKKFFHYNPDTGALSWKVFPPKFRKGSIQLGEPIGKGRKYAQLMFKKQHLLIHRVAWLLYTGKWPEKQLDHINRDTTDNRIENLREATHTENQRNRAKGKKNTSGFKGVSWITREQKWMAGIKVDGKSYNLGYFSTSEKAHEAYQAAAIRYHREFANA